MTEQGFKELAYVEWLGWFGPAQMPAARVAALNAAVNEALATPAMIEALGKSALEPLRASAAQFAAQVRQEHGYWAQVVKTTGFQPEDA